jgi:pimeloyl-ACP methyl ester carboxylesterase
MKKKLEHTLRARFKKEIVCEFVSPARRSNKVIILCGGAPTMPSAKDLLLYLSNKGYWAFFPRYRGTWESGGTFLKKSLHLDIRDVIDELPRGFTAFGLKPKRYRIARPEIYLVGGSFGGPAALLASRDERVKKAFVISPVVDWRAPSKAEPMGWLEGFMREAFGMGYRFKHSDWRKLMRGRFYNPVHEIHTLDPKKIYIIHTKDDESVRAKEVVQFAEKLGCTFTLLKKGGHTGARALMRPVMWHRFERFITS